MAKTPEELEKAQTDLGAAIAAIQTKLSAKPEPNVEMVKELADLKVAFGKLTPAKKTEEIAAAPGFFDFLDHFNPFK